MITRELTAETSRDPTPSRPGPAPWQRLLAGGVGTLEELLRLLELDAAGLDLPELGGALAHAAAKDFPLRVPRGFVRRMRRRDPADPLLLQVLPAAAETREVAGWNREPLGEADFSPVPGLLHKYAGRALLVVTGACAVHCRYCFRRHFPYGEHAADWGPALEHLAADASIREVILSGGDPLSLTDIKLARLVAELEGIPHLERLRLHTRLPIVLPERVDDALLAWLTGGRLRPVVVVHANHPREIDAEVTAAMGRLRAAGVTLLNQSVLLRGVNDDAAVLCDLSETLFEAGVMPYYLHVMDRVSGAAHFYVPDSDAKRLVRQLRASLPGYLVPRLVRESPGAPSKTPLGA